MMMMMMASALPHPAPVVIFLDACQGTLLHACTLWHTLNFTLRQAFGLFRSELYYNLMIYITIKKLKLENSKFRMQNSK